MNGRKPPMWLSLSLLVLAGGASGQETEDCVLQGILEAPDGTTLADIRSQCNNAVEVSEDSKGEQYMDCVRLRSVAADDAATAGTVKAECEQQMASGQELPERLVQSRTTESNPYVITPLRQNYILPYTYNRYPNQTDLPGAENVELDKEEAKLQISLMVPVTYTDLFTANDGIYFGFTLKSFWQVYNEDISAPFRETNYRPEFFYQAPLPISSTRGVWMGRVGFEHESNGRSQYLSRSWNRAYVALAYVRPEWALAIQPWYRFPENDKKDDGDPDTPPPASGDDNPDILDYMGHFEMTGVYKWQKLEFSGMFRRNFDEGHGAFEVGVSFPLWGRLRGYAQYFDGYGESLIDYDHKNQRIGVGVLLTDLL